MNDNPMAEMTIRVRELEGARETLLIVKDMLSAQDLTRCYVALQEPSDSPLTVEVKQRLVRLEGLLKDYYAEQGMLAAQQLDEEVEDEFEVAGGVHAVDALPGDPLRQQLSRTAPALPLEGER
jgi:hypothetical protein